MNKYAHIYINELNKHALFGWGKKKTTPSIGVATKLPSSMSAATIPGPDKLLSSMPKSFDTNEKLDAATKLTNLATNSEIAPDAVNRVGSVIGLDRLNFTPPPVPPHNSGPSVPPSIFPFT